MSDLSVGIAAFVGATVANGAMLYGAVVLSSWLEDRRISRQNRREANSAPSKLSRADALKTIFCGPLVLGSGNVQVMYCASDMTSLSNANSRWTLSLSDPVFLQWHWKLDPLSQSRYGTPVEYVSAPVSNPNLAEATNSTMDPLSSGHSQEIATATLFRAGGSNA